MSTKEDVLENRIANIEKCVESIQEKLDNLQIAFTSQRLCPHPGLCVTLQTLLDSMEKRLDSVESQTHVLTEARGKVWGAALALSCLIPVLTTILVTIIAKVIK